MDFDHPFRLWFLLFVMAEHLISLQSLIFCLLQCLRMEGWGKPVWWNFIYAVGHSMEEHESISSSKNLSEIIIFNQINISRMLICFPQRDSPISPISTLVIQSPLSPPGQVNMQKKKSLGDCAGSVREVVRLLIAFHKIFKRGTAETF